MSVLDDKCDLLTYQKALSIANELASCQVVRH